MKGFSKRFAAVAMVAGLALTAAACESEGGETTDPAQEAPADDTGIGGDTGTDTGSEDLGTTDDTSTEMGTESESTTP